MGSSITRRLLRDWKHLLRSSSHADANNENRLFLLKPQESNLHIWHLVLTEPSTSMELYFILYINESMNDQIIIGRCLTPCDNFPFDKYIPLSYLFPILKEHGFHTFIMQLWYICFGNNNNYNNMNSNKCCFTSNFQENNHNDRVARMLKAWNRIMYKDFKLYFPELVGFLQPGDYQSVKLLSKRVNDSKYSTLSYPKNNYDHNPNASQSETVSTARPLNIHDNIYTPDTFCTNKNYTCDNIASLKRTRLSWDDIQCNYEEDDDAFTTSSKRRRV